MMMYSRPYLESLIRYYYTNPEAFTPEQLQEMEVQAKVLGIDFDKTLVHSQKPAEWSIGSILKQFGAGFLQGFTTLATHTEPEELDTPAERIARSLGSLAGFIGFIPGKRIPVWGSIAHAARGRSLPVLISKTLTDKLHSSVALTADRIIAHSKSKALRSALQFLKKEDISSTLEGMSFYGTASAVSNWQYGVDAIIEGMLHGAAFGGVQRGLANVIRTGGEPPLGTPFLKMTEQQQLDRVVRGIAGALFAGLPSTMRGDTPEEQIYEYLIGAYFGAQEPSARQLYASKFLDKIQHDLRLGLGDKKLQEIQQTKDYKILEEETRKLVDSYLKQYQTEEIRKLTGWVLKQYAQKLTPEQRQELEETLEEAYRYDPQKLLTESEDLELEAEALSRRPSVEFVEQTPKYRYIVPIYSEATAPSGKPLAFRRGEQALAESEKTIKIPIARSPKQPLTETELKESMRQLVETVKEEAKAGNVVVIPKLLSYKNPNFNVNQVVERVVYPALRELAEHAAYHDYKIDIRDPILSKEIIFDDTGRVVERKPIRTREIFVVAGEPEHPLLYQVAKVTEASLGKRALFYSGDTTSANTLAELSASKVFRIAKSSTAGKYYQHVHQALEDYAKKPRNYPFLSVPTYGPEKTGYIKINEGDIEYAANILSQLKDLSTKEKVPKIVLLADLTEQNGKYMFTEPIKAAIAQLSGRKTITVLGILGGRANWYEYKDGKIDFVGHAKHAPTEDDQVTFLVLGNQLTAKQKKQTKYLSTIIADYLGGKYVKPSVEYGKVFGPIGAEEIGYFVGQKMDKPEVPVTYLTIAEHDLIGEKKTYALPDTYKGEALEQVHDKTAALFLEQVEEGAFLSHKTYEFLKSLSDDNKLTNETIKREVLDILNRRDMYFITEQQEVAMVDNGNFVGARDTKNKIINIFINKIDTLNLDVTQKVNLVDEFKEFIHKQLELDHVPDREIIQYLEESKINGKNITLSDDEKLEIRNAALKLYHNRMVKQYAVNITMENGEMQVELTPITNYGLDGKLKMLNQPIPYTDKQTIKLYEHLGSELPKDKSGTILPNLVVIRSFYLFGEHMEHTHLANNRFFSQESGKFENLLNTVITKMAERGYYPVSGAGDKTNIYFRREHPLMSFFFKDKYQNLRPYLIDFLQIAEQTLGVDNLVSEYLKTNPTPLDDFISVNGLLYMSTVNGFDTPYTLNAKGERVYHTKDSLDAIAKEQNPLVELFLPVLLKKQFNANFITDAVAYNKRQQIVESNGVPLEAKRLYEYIPEYGNLLEHMKDKPLAKKIQFEKDGLPFIIVDGTKTKNQYSNSLAIENQEFDDGAIYILPEVVQAINRTYGLEPNNHNKSYIQKQLPVYELQDGLYVSGGALLGKYMFHSVPEELAKAMRKHGIAMIITTNSAKQYGLLQPIKLEGKSIQEHLINLANDIHAGKASWNVEQFIDKLVEAAGSRSGGTIKPEEIVGVLTEKVDKHNYQRVNIAKQFLTNLSAYAMLNNVDLSLFTSAKTNQELLDIILQAADKNTAEIRAFLTEIISKEQHGTEYFNDLALQLINKIRSGEVRSSYIKLLNKVLDNINRVGFHHISALVNTPEISADVLRKIFNVNREFLEMDMEEGFDGSFDTDLIEQGDMDHIEFSTSVERLMNLTDEPMFTLAYKPVNQYAQRVMRSYFINRLSRPLVPNSFTARLRPWDIESYFGEIEFLDIDTGKMVKTTAHALDRIEVQDDFLPDIKESKLAKYYFLDRNYGEHLKVNVDQFGSLLPKTLTRYIKVDDTGERYVIFNDVVKAIQETDDLHERKNLSKMLRLAAPRVPMDSISGAAVVEFGGYLKTEGYGILMHPRRYKAIGGADTDGDKAFGYLGLSDGIINMYKNNQYEFYEFDGTGYRFIDPKVSMHPSVKGKSMRDVLTTTNDEVKGSQLNLKSFANVVNYKGRLKASFGAAGARAYLGPAVLLRSFLMQTTDLIIRDNIDTIRKGETVVLPVSFTDKKGHPIDLELVLKFNKDTVYRKQLGQLAIPRTKMDDMLLVARSEIAFGCDPMDEAGVRPLPVWVDTLFRELFDVRVSPKARNVNASQAYIEKLNQTTYHWKDLVPFYRLIANINTLLYGKDAHQKTFTAPVVHIGAKALYRDLIRSTKHNVHPVTALPIIANQVSDIGLDVTLSPFSFLKSINYKKLLDAYDGLAETPYQQLFANIINRASNRVVKSKLIEFILEKNLYSSGVKERIIYDNQEYAQFVKEVNEMNLPIKLKSNLTNKIDRLQEVERVLELANDYLYNDIRTMASTILLSRVATNIEPVKIKGIIAKVAQLRDYRAKEYARFKSNISKGRSVASNIAAIDMDVSAKYKEFRDSLATVEERLFADYAMLSSLEFKSDLDAALLRDMQNNLSSYSELQRKTIRKAISQLSHTISTSMMFNVSSIPNSSVRQFIAGMNSLYETLRSGKLPTELLIASEKVKKAVTTPEQVDVAPVNGTIIYRYLKDAYDRPIEPEKIDWLSKEDQKAIREFSDHLAYFAGSIGTKIGEFIAAISPNNKAINNLTIDDIRYMNNYLKDLRYGTIFRKLFGKKGKGVEFLRVYWYLFPETVARDFYEKGFDLQPVKGKILLPDGEYILGDLYYPVNTLNQVILDVSHLMSMVSADVSELESELEKKLVFLDSTGPYKHMIIMKAIAEHEYNIHSYIESLKLPEEKKNWIHKVFRESREYATAQSRYEEWKNKEFLIPDENGVLIKKNGDELIGMIKKAITEMNKLMYNRIVGSTSALLEYAQRDDNGQVMYWDYKETIPKLNYQQFIRDVREAINSGKGFKKEIGLEGIYLMELNQRIANAFASGNKAFALDIIKKGHKSFTEYPFDAYYPHFFSNYKISETAFKNYVQHIESLAITKEEKIELLKGAVAKLFNRDEFPDINFRAYSSLLDQAAKEYLKEAKQKQHEYIHWFREPSRTFTNLLTREAFLGGWDLTLHAYSRYIQNMVRTYYQQAAQVLAKDSIDNFYVISKDYLTEQQREAWSTYLKLYVQDALGYPTIIPDELVNKPHLKLDWTLYKATADNRVARWIIKLKKALGIKVKTLEEEMQQLTASDIRRWSNMEARYQLASLLAYPKTMIGNLYGGSLNTLSSVGHRHFLNAMNLDWIRANINPEFKTMSDVEQWVISKGVVPEMVMEEGGLAREKFNTNMTNFLQDLASKLMQDPQFSDSSVRELARKHNLGDLVTHKAAWFMRKSERMLRVHSFIAHYSWALENYGKMVGNISRDDPILIAMAKKGVEATQFLYSAPHRPAFARTGLGRILTRFQLWAWNSVRLRNEVERMARMYGFRQGSEEFQRLQRFVTLDITALALGNLFMYSIFDTALPQPVAWLQDFANWLFGDKEERERAFYGMYPTVVAPLQMITAPIMRMPAALFDATLTGNWDRISDYYIWTLFPFGRIARDIAGPNNFLSHPSNLLDKTLGIPYIGFARASEDIQLKSKELQTYNFGG